MPMKDLNAQLADQSGGGENKPQLERPFRRGGAKRQTQFAYDFGNITAIRPGERNSLDEQVQSLGQVDALIIRTAAGQEGIELQHVYRPGLPFVGWCVHPIERGRWESNPSSDRVVLASSALARSSSLVLRLVRAAGGCHRWKHKAQPRTSSRCTPRFIKRMASSESSRPHPRKASLYPLAWRRCSRHMPKLHPRIPRKSLRAETQGRGQRNRC